MFTPWIRGQGRLHGSLVMTIPKSDRVSTENGWKSVLLENVNCVNLNRFRLKRLIPNEHDLRVHTTLLASMCRAMPFSARAHFL